MKSIIPILLLSALTVPAETLIDLLRETEAQNPDILASQKQWNAARERIVTASALPDPRLSYSYYLQEIQTKTGPQQQKAGLSQTFPLFGKRELRGDAATFNAEALGARARAVRASILFDLKKNWLELYYLTRALETEETRLHLFHTLERSKERAVENGRSARGLLDIRISLAQIQDQICTLEVHQTPLQTAINALMNRDHETPVAPPDLLPPVQEVRAEDLHTTFHLNNPAIAEQNSYLARRKVQRDLAERNWVPDITLEANWIETGDGGEDPVIGSVAINLPIWHAKNRAERLAAELNEAAQHHHLQGDINNIQVLLTHQLTKRAHAIHRIDLHKNDLIPSAEQHLELTRIAFENGEIGLNDLTTSEERLLRLRLMLERKRTNRAIAEAHIEKLLGGVDIPPAQNGIGSTE